MSPTLLSEDLAYTAAATAALLAAALLGLAMVLRIMLVRRQAASERAKVRWRSAFLEAIDNERAFPRIARRERVPVLVLWNQLHETIRGPMQERLREVARNARLHDIAMRFLKHGKRSDRLLGVTTAGNLRLGEAWNAIVPLTRAASPVLASAAARALVRIDRQASISVLVPLLLERGDLHPARIGPVMIEAGDDLALALAERLAAADATDQLHIVKLVEATKNPKAAPAVRAMLSTSEDGEVIASCLRVLADLHDPRDAWSARRHLRHSASFVRVQAAAALGKLGVRADEPRLVEMLTDKEWWVRYRAAQALVSFPFLTREHLQHVSTNHPDRYARDAMRQALAEGAPR